MDFVIELPKITKDNFDILLITIYKFTKRVLLIPNKGTYLAID